MSAYLLFGGILGLVFGIAYVANLKYSKPVVGVVWGYSALFFNENIGSGHAAVFVIAALVGAAIVIVPFERCRSNPCRRIRVGDDAGGGRVCC